MITGGVGDNYIYGGSGSDVLIGGTGYNVRTTTESYDYGDGVVTNTWGEESAYHYVYGDSGDDVLIGGEGFNYLYGGSGDDVVIAGDSNESTFFGEGDEGESWDNVLYGDSGSDVLIGGAGDDLMYGGFGEGGDDADTFVVAAGGGLDQINDFGIEDELIFDGFAIDDLDDARDAQGDLVIGAGEGDDRVEVTIRNTDGSGYSVTEDEETGNAVVTINPDTGGG